MKNSFEVFDECQDHGSLLELFDHYASGFGYQSYIFHGSIDRGLESPCLLGVARGLPGLFELAGYGDLHPVDEEVGTAPENVPSILVDPFVQLIPIQQMTPVKWTVESIFDDGHNQLAIALNSLGVDNGITIVVRGRRNELGSVTFMQCSRKQKCLSNGYQVGRGSFCGLSDIPKMIPYWTGLTTPKNKAEPNDDLLRTDAETAPSKLIFELEGIQSSFRAASDALMLVSLAMDRARVLDGGAARVEILSETNTYLVELTAREKDVAYGLIKGEVVKKIAARLDCSVSNVQHYVRRLYKKLSVNTRGSAISKLRILGISELQD